MTLPFETKPPIALSVAGFDPSSGAGVTADLQTFAAHGVYGLSCITGMTVQSTRGVRRVELCSADLLADSLRYLDDDLKPVGIKIGMLGSAALVRTVVAFLREVRDQRSVYVVLDPVLCSSSGTTLLDNDGVSLLKEELLPLCDCATPNRGELRTLTQDPADDPVEMLEEARRLQQRIGGHELIVTGGDEPEPSDLLLLPSDETQWLIGKRVETTATHGTGCAFSSALLSKRLLGEDLAAAAAGAKCYVEGALRAAPRIGHGRGPMNLLWTRPLG